MNKGKEVFCTDCFKHLGFSWLWGGRARNEEYIQKVLKKVKPEVTETMMKGRGVHDTLAQGRGVRTDTEEIFNSICSGRRTVWSGFVCSGSLRLHGLPDAIVSVLEDRKTDYMLRHWIIEDKLGWKKGYLLQLDGEGMALSDRLFVLHTDTSDYNSYTASPSIVFYDELEERLECTKKAKPLHLEVYCVLNHYESQDNPIDNCLWLAHGKKKPDKSPEPWLWSRDYSCLNHELYAAVIGMRKMRQSLESPTKPQEQKLDRMDEWLDPKK